MMTSAKYGHTFPDINAFSLEQLAQFVDLLLELSNEFRVRVLVDHGLADDLLGAVGVSVSFTLIFIQRHIFIFF